MNSHPNAVVGGATAAAGGALIVWISSLLGYSIPVEVVPVLSGLCAAIVLAVGREGVCGVARDLWSGEEK